MSHLVRRVRGSVIGLACVVIASGGLPARGQLAHYWNFSESGTSSGTVYADKAKTLFPGLADTGVVSSSMTTQGAAGTPLNGVGVTVNGQNAVRVIRSQNYIPSTITNFATDFGDQDGAVSFTMLSMIQLTGYGTNGNGYLFGDNTAPGPVQVYTRNNSSTWAYSGNSMSSYSGAQNAQRWATSTAEINQFGGWFFVAVRGDASTGVLDYYLSPVGQQTMANSIIHLRGSYNGIAKAANPLMLGGGRTQYEATQSNNGVVLYSEARTLDQINYDYANWFNPQPRNTWWGNGSNANWTTAGNWTSGVPVAGEYQFGNLYGNRNGTANNNSVGLSVAGLRFLGNADQAGINAGSVTLTGNALTVTGTITDNSTNPQVIAVPLTLGTGAGAFAVTAGGRLTVSQPITTSVDVTKTGPGTLVLTGANTYAAATTITAGALEANEGVGLSGSSNVVLAGGVLQGNGTASLTRAIGTAAGQLQWAGDGGFAARGGVLTVTLNNDAATPVSWGTAGFVPGGSELVFGSESANARVVLANAVDLNGGDRSVRVDSGAGGDLAEMSGVVAGSSAGLVKTGTGTLILSGVNTYTGNTRVVAGAIEAVDGTGLGADTNLELAGGVFQGAGTFTRTVGTSANQVQWSAGGGFAARGGTLTVTLNNDAATPLVWGDPGFVPTGSAALTFGSRAANARVNLQNAIDLGGITRVVQVTAGAGGDIAELSGVVSDSLGAAGLDKGGTGTLLLGGANTYMGTTRIMAGAIEAVDGVGLPTLSNLQFSGGVFQGAGVSTFERTLGSGSGQVRWSGDGGFSARGGKHSVSIGGAFTATSLTWGSTAGFAADNMALVFGSNTSDSETDMWNPVNLGTAMREVRVNTGTGTDFATLSGVVSAGTGGGLVKTGPGLLKLSATNTYTGGTNLAAGTILLSNAAALGPSGPITFTGTSTLRFDTGITTDLSASGRMKVNDGVTANIDTNGNAVTFNGVIGVGAAVTGVLNKTGAGDLVLGTATDAAATASTGSFAGRMTISGGRVVLGNSLALQNTLLDYDQQGGTLSFGSRTAATIGSISGSQGLDISGVTLTIGSNTYNAASSSTTTGIAAANANNTTTYAGNLTGTGAASLVKSGAGTLTLAGANTYAGTTTINGGALGIATAGSLAGGNLAFAAPLLTVQGSSSGMPPAGGLIESNDTVFSGGFTRAIGTGAGQVQWTGHGGFSAKGGNLTVNIGGSGGDFDWSATGAPGTNQLMLGWGTSDGTVDFQNPMLLTSTVAATRTINVSAGSGSVPEARISGQIKETAPFAGAITKAGTGTLELTNTANSYTGVTTVSGGVLRVTAPGQLGLNSTAAAITLTNGNLELRADAATQFQPVSGAGVTVSGPSLVKVDRAVGGSGTNGTHSLGGLTISGQQLTVAGGNGYGLTFGAVTLTGSPTITNVLPGTLTLGAVSAASTATMTINGGSTTVTGNMPSTANVTVNPLNGAATVRLNGATNANTVTINGGTVYAPNSLATATVNAGTLYADTSLTTVTVSGGTAYANTALGTATVNNGTLYAGNSPSATLTTATVNGGTMYAGGPLGGAITMNSGRVLATSGVTVGSTLTVAAAGLYTQNFNTLTSLPTGWSVLAGATATSNGTASTFTGAAASSAWNVATGGFYNMASSAPPSASTDTVTTQQTRTDRALGVVQSAAFGNPGAAVNYSFSTAGKTVTSLGVGLQCLNAANGPTTWSLQYGIGTTPTSWTTLGTWTDPNVWGGTTNQTFDTSVFGTSLDNQSTVLFRVVALSPQGGSAPYNTIGIDNFTLNYGQIVGSDITSGSAGFSGEMTLNNGAQLTAAGSSTVTFSGRLTGAGGVTKIGDGTVSMTWGVNDYLGGTTVSAGALVLGSTGALPGGIGATGGTSALTFDGGVLGLGAEDYARPLAAAGTAAAANFRRAGGWAAYGADRTVNVGGALATIDWGAADTGFNGQTLILGAGSATNTVDLRNPLALGSGVRTVRVDDGAAGVDGRLSGVISGPVDGALVKTGTGTLELTGANTYSGPTTVSAGTVRMGHAQALGTSAVTVSGGTLATSRTSSLASLTVSTGQVRLDSNETHALAVGTFALNSQAGGGLVDVGVGRVEIAGGADGTVLRDALLAGGAGAGWGGTTGIVSSQAATSGGTRTVGYRVAGDGSAVLAFAAPGDVDLDGVVNTIDLVGISAGGKYGTGQPAVWDQGDFNYDGVVNSLDLVAIASSGVWGTGNYLPLPSAPPNPVPEPAGLVLIAAAGLAGLAAMRRR